MAHDKTVRSPSERRRQGSSCRAPDERRLGRCGLSLLAGVALLLVLLLSLSGCLNGRQTEAAANSPEQQTASTNGRGTISAAETILEPVSAAASTAVSEPVSAVASAANLDALVTGSLALALDVFRTLCAAELGDSKNVVLSPYGASLALALAYAGADGETERQMAEVLRFTLPKDRLPAAFAALNLRLRAREGVQIEVASFLWPFLMGRRLLLADYLQLISRYYQTSVIIPPENVDEAIRVINSWVKDSTNGRVTEVLPPESLPDEFTALVLLNVLTFSGRWSFRFPTERTAVGTFHLPDGTAIQVPLMRHAMNYG